MNRLDQETLLRIEIPALALGWPVHIVRKLDRASKQKTPREIPLTEEEVTILSEHINAPRGWLNHRGVQISFRGSTISRLC